MKTVILDYESGCVYFFPDLIREEDIESKLKEHGIDASINNIYYMTNENGLGITMFK